MCGAVVVSVGMTLSTNLVKFSILYCVKVVSLPIKARKLHSRTSRQSASKVCILDIGVSVDQPLEGHGKPHYILTSNGEARRVSPEDASAKVSPRMDL
ncbi:Uncharacterized protein TCM_035906 [Theobroma cacao]|uniref:Uncharacterized protein n=1 Tax=Theobroma cacao TaxID=3641 RepID=A0A061FHU3_THECC|nr:Uncharacterized protein TCM_035906 [Theobroma cacao]